MLEFCCNNGLSYIEYIVICASAAQAGLVILRSWEATPKGFRSAPNLKGLRLSGLKD